MAQPKLVILRGALAGGLALAVCLSIVAARRSSVQGQAVVRTDAVPGSASVPAGSSVRFHGDRSGTDRPVDVTVLNASDQGTSVAYDGSTLTVTAPPAAGIAVLEPGCQSPNPPTNVIQCVLPAQSNVWVTVTTSDGTAWSGTTGDAGATTGTTGFSSTTGGTTGATGTTGFSSTTGNTSGPTGTTGFSSTTGSTTGSTRGTFSTGTTGGTGTRGTSGFSTGSGGGTPVSTP